MTCRYDSSCATQCDRVRECPDGEDELSCPCTENEFTCRDGSCIDAGRKCDGRYDCRDYSDEDRDLCSKKRWPILAKILAQGYKITKLCCLTLSSGLQPAQLPMQRRHLPQRDCAL